MQLVGVGRCRRISVLNRMATLKADAYVRIKVT